MPISVPTSLATNDQLQEHKIVRRISRRLLPFLFLLYLIASIDRSNVAFAALQMNHDLGFSASVYGFGAGIFFIGYCLFEIPSNLILARVVARRRISRIMVSWGIVACLMMLNRGRVSFYTLRFLLGAAEAGFFPGMIFYLGQWFPAAERARAVSRFMMAIPVAGVLGGVLAGGLLGLDGKLGLAGWQWLFLLEGLPSVVLGVAVWFVLSDSPEHASWLSDPEHAVLLTRLNAERAAVETSHGRKSVRQATRSRENLASCGRRNAALSRHFQQVLGIDGQPEEYAVIIGNWFSTRGRSSGFGDLSIELPTSQPLTAPHRNSFD